MINIEKLNNRIQHLQSGKSLIMEHPGFGKYKFTMNSNQNVICAKPINTRAENHEKDCRIVAKNGEVCFTAESVRMHPEMYLMWGCGEWSVVIKPETVELVRVKTPGIYKKL